MPTKTDRMFSYLPSVFRRSPDRSALFALLDAFGAELQHGENSLAAIMQAHWVDHADRGAEIIEDLARIAALYGLAPRGAKSTENAASEGTLCALPMPGAETVEEFRRHLKRYIRTFLDGTVTVQGVLRVVAEALGLTIADDYADLASWWQAPTDELVTEVADGDDAANFLLGFATATAVGSAALPAQLQGTVDLSQGVDLRHAAILRLKIDEQSPVDIDLVEGAADPTSAPISWIAVAINVACGAPIARHDGHYLTLASPTLGPSSRLEVQEVVGDAAERLLGLPPRTYTGSTARAAQVQGMRDLSGGVDLSVERYLRLQIDGTMLAEIDCAGPTPGHVTLDQLVDTINTALGAVASHDGHFLRLTSPTIGAASIVNLQQPAAQDATLRLFGPVNRVVFGQGDQPARATSRRDLSRGIDLSQRSWLQVSVDGTVVTVNCATRAVDQANTRLSEISDAINRAAQAVIARDDGRFLSLTSPTVGPTGSLVFEPALAGDATADIFGIVPRTFTGKAATAARLTGLRDLGDDVNLAAQHTILLGLDDTAPVPVDLRTGISDPTAIGLDALVAAANSALGKPVFSHDGGRLVLTSPTIGAGSRLAVLPLLTTMRRRFVTRAAVTDEAAQTILGFVNKTAQGAAALPAQLTGKTDLSRGVDLSTDSFLRLIIDNGAAVDIDCAGKRPRATILDEIVAKINAQVGEGVATHNGRNLVLISPTAGAQSRLAFEPAQAQDAGAALLGVAPGAIRGENGTKVFFTGTADLSHGIDLPGGAAIQLGLDDAPPVLIPLTTQPMHQSLDALVTRINVAFQKEVASHDNMHLRLTSSQIGAASQIRFAPAGDHDVTAALFGILPPRAYQGLAEKPAMISGQVDLSGAVDLSLTRFLRLALNGGPLVDIDCADPANPAQTELDHIKDAINQAMKKPVAFTEGDRLVLRSPNSGSASQLTLAPYPSGDARTLLLGDVPDETLGQAPAPAVITGVVDLLTPVNLAERSVIRLVKDGERPLDIDVAGAAPAQTIGDEIVAAINQILPGVAALTPEDHLQLTSPTRGEDSRLALLPLRYLELIEYPSQLTTSPVHAVQHSAQWVVTNTGAADVFADVEIQAPHGVVGPGLVNTTLGWQLRLLTPLTAGATACLRRDPVLGLQVTITAPGQESQKLPAEQILVTPVDEPRSNGRQWATLTAQEQAIVLRLPQGRSAWRYLDCYSSRFNQANFDKACFVCCACNDRGVFNVSRFVQKPAKPLAAVFTATPPLADPPVYVTFRWAHHQAGAFQVNLPVDLPPRFGGRFNTARFGQPANAPEVYTGVVIEPEDDEHHLVQLITQNKNSLVKATVIHTNPELGWAASAIPLRKPQFLTLGNTVRPARLYLNAEGVDGFILVEAREAGAWGNRIAVSTRPAGPGRYDVCVLFQGDQFENARQAALGEPLPALTQELLQPNAIGVLQAKAAGVRAEVTREDT